MRVDLHLSELNRTHNRNVPTFQAARQIGIEIGTGGFIGASIALRNIPIIDQKAELGDRDNNLHTGDRNTLGNKAHEGKLNS